MKGAMLRAQDAVSPRRQGIQKLLPNLRSKLPPGNARYGAQHVQGRAGLPA